MAERRDLIRVTHYTPELFSNVRYGYPACPAPGPRFNVTTDRDKVTCKACRKRLGLPAVSSHV